MKHLLLPLCAVATAVLVSSSPLPAAPEYYELEGKDDAAVKRVMDALHGARPFAVFKDRDAFLESLRQGESYEWVVTGEAPKCKECLGLGRVSAIGETKDNKKTCPVCNGGGRLTPEKKTYVIVWNKALAADRHPPVQPAVEEILPSEYKPSNLQHYSPLKIGKIKLRAHSIESGTRNQRFDGWWGWERIMQHLRTVEITINNVSKDPSKVRVELFWIGDSVGASGGAFAYGLNHKEFSLGPGLEEKFYADTITSSARWNTIFGRGATGNRIQGYVIRTVETVEGKPRITGYHASMPHIIKYINSTPSEIKDSGVSNIRAE